MIKRIIKYFKSFFEFKLCENNHFIRVKFKEDNKDDWFRKLTGSNFDHKETLEITRREYLSNYRYKEDYIRIFKYKGKKCWIHQADYDKLIPILNKFTYSIIWEQCGSIHPFSKFCLGGKDTAKIERSTGFDGYEYFIMGKLKI